MRHVVRYALIVGMLLTSFSVEAITVSQQLPVASATSSPTLSISINTPNNGDIISHTVTVSTTPSVTTTIGVNEVIFKVDKTVKATVTTAPYQWNWETSKDTVGAHTLAAVVVDNYGNSIAATETVTLTDWVTPTVSINGLRAGTAYKGIVPLTLQLKDNVGVSSWGLHVATALTPSIPITTAIIAVQGPSTNVTYNWNTTAITQGDGVYGVVITGTDAATSTPSLNNVGTSAPITITVDNTPAVMTSGGVTTTTNISNTIPLTASVSDATSGVKSVQVKFDSKSPLPMTTVGTATTNGPNNYTYSWNTAPYTVGQHIINILATDNAGNVTTNTYTVTETDWITPTVKLTGVTAGLSYKGSVPLNLTISDNVGAKSWGLVARGISYTVPITSASGVTLTNSSITPAWATTAITTDGSYGLILTATDAAGNVGTTSVVTVTADNTAPVLASGGITSSESVSGTLPLTATVSDPSSGVKSVQVKFGSNSPVSMVSSGTSTLHGPDNYTYSWNTTAYTVGVHTVNILATDNAGNVSTNTYTVNEPDWITPTVKLSGVTTNASYKGVVPLTFNLSDNTGVITYALRAYSGTSVVSTITSTSGVSLTASTPVYSWATTGITDGVYALQLAGADSTGNIGVSPLTTVTVDNTAPSLSSGGVANSESVSHTLAITASASDVTSGVKSVTLQVDSHGAVTMSPVGTTTTNGPNNYSYSWNTTTYTVGAHIITILATDKAGNVITNTYTVTEPDWIAPVVSLTSPTSSSNNNGTKTVSGVATDNVAVVTDTLLITGTGTGTSSIISPTTQAHVSGSGVSMTWNTANVPDGAYNVQLDGIDAAGNTGFSSVHAVIVDNLAPTVSITTTPATSTVTGTIVIAVTASDPTPSDGATPSGLATTKLQIDGTAIATLSGTAPTYHWSTKSVGDGNHAITAVTTDKAGNSTTSSTITVNVAN